MATVYENNTYRVESGHVAQVIVDNEAPCYAVINKQTNQVEVEEFMLPRAIDYANQLEQHLIENEPVELTVLQ